MDQGGGGGERTGAGSSVLCCWGGRLRSDDGLAARVWDAYDRIDYEAVLATSAADVAVDDSAEELTYGESDLGFCLDVVARADSATSERAAARLRWAWRWQSHSSREVPERQRRRRWSRSRSCRSCLRSPPPPLPSPATLASSHCKAHFTITMCDQHTPETQQPSGRLTPTTRPHSCCGPRCAGRLRVRVQVRLCGRAARGAASPRPSAAADGPPSRRPAGEVLCL